MKAGPIEVGKLLQNRYRYCVPIYQRHYVWDEKRQWEPFWNDIRTKAIERLAERERRFSHFMGAVVLETRGGFSARKVPSFQVVDGQQRLTTFQLFLAAARDYANSIGYTSGAEVISTYIVNRDSHLMEDPEVEIYKVWPTQYDRELFTDIISLGGRAELRKKYRDYFYKYRDKIYSYSTTPKLLGAYGYFYDRIRHAVETDDLDDEFFEVPEPDDDVDEPDSDASETPHANGTADLPKELRLDAVWQSLVEEFKVVEITLEEGDDAQVIFETLNERGQPLLAADLVRNNIFQRADAADRTAEKLFDKYWKPFENPFWDVAEKQGRYKKPRIEFFLGNYISAKIASEVNLSKLFSEYKAFIKRRPFATVADELADLNHFGSIYGELVAREGDNALARFATRLVPWEVTTVFPLVMRLWDSPLMEVDEKARCLDLLLSFVVRRAVCNLTTKNYNKFFISAVDHLQDVGFTFDNLLAFLLAQTSETGRMPKDQEFEARWVGAQLYGRLTAGRVRAILEELEHAMRGKHQETVTLKQGLTVEHLMPQTWEDNWPLASGSPPSEDALYEATYSTEEDSSEVGAIVRRERLLQSIGNLTLLTQPLNSSVSNASFDDKWPAIRAQSLLMLSKDAMSLNGWDEDAIEKRSKELFKLARAVWPMPATENAGATS